MRSETRCENARLQLSMQLDSELPSHQIDPLSDHLTECEECRAYQSGLHELRRRLRVAPATPPPDLTVKILHRIRVEDDGEVTRFRVKLAAVAAAAAALLVLTTAIPIFDAIPEMARATEITRRVFAAGRDLSRYHATFEITERGWHPTIPIRRFSAEIWFDAPESFRLSVRDRTAYPSAVWPRNDVEVISSPGRWSIRESYSCPPAALPGCAIEAGVEDRTIVRRQPFDGVSDAPRDLVLPLDSLASSDTFVVAGRASLQGRDAYHLVLPYRQAFPLVEALQLGGSWAPLDPDDMVDLWVDAETSFPLRFRATREDQVRLEVKTTALDERSRFSSGLFRSPIRGTISDGGFVAGGGPSPSLLPSYLSDLEPHRSGRNAQGQRIATYAEGLNYLTVTADRTRRPAPLLMESAEVVELGNGSRGFYRPAGPGGPRRLDLYTGRAHVQLASNLRRGELLRIGASLRLVGRAPTMIRQGDAVIERLEGGSEAAFPAARRLSHPPEGYSLVATVHIRDGISSQLVHHYMPSESGSSSSGIRVVQAPNVDGLPPSSEDLFSVRVGGVLGRWSEERGELEWIDRDEVYRAIAAPSFDLSDVLGLAEGME